jgi:hypothetical protein
MRKTFKCKICGKVNPVNMQINGKTVHRSGFCFECMPRGMTHKEIGNVVGRLIVENKNKENNTFKCVKCKRTIRKEIGPRNNRLRRRKYCIECLPKNEHPKSLESNNGKEIECLTYGRIFIYKSGFNKNTLEKCYRCNAKDKRRELKKKIISIKGGECQICGYKKYNGSLTLHHINPTQKEITISKAFTWSRIVEELPKCILVCFNCHQEIHGGITKIPKRLLKNLKERINRIA